MSPFIPRERRGIRFLQLNASTLYDFPNMKVQKSTISIDWLQVNCTRSDNRTDLYTWFTSPQTNEHGNHYSYILTDAQEWTFGYTYHKSVMLGKVCVAHISWLPKRENVDEMTCSVKLSNNLLYTNQWHFILGDLTKALGWRINGITRIDIACDLNYFLHGLRPEVFIHKYLKGRNCSYIRCGSNKFSVVGEKYEQSTRVDYIRWGSRTSGVCTYLYNKSKEMREKKMKPWIIDRWRGAGLDVKNVWRIEFSISSTGRGLRDIETGLIHTLFVDDVESQQQLRSIFQTYCLRYFHFKHLRKSGAKYVKDMQDCELIDLSQTSTLIPCQLYQTRKNSSTVQSAILQVETLRDELLESKCERQGKEMQHIDYVTRKLINKLEQQKRAEMAEESLQEQLAYRILLNTKQLTASERVLRANSYMSDELYKRDICLRTAKRIAHFLINRKNYKYFLSSE